MKESTSSAILLALLAVSFSLTFVPGLPPLVARVGPFVVALALLVVSAPIVAAVRRGSL